MLKVGGLSTGLDSRTAGECNRNISNFTVATIAYRYDMSWERQAASASPAMHAVQCECHTMIGRIFRQDWKLQTSYNQSPGVLRN